MSKKPLRLFHGTKGPAFDQFRMPAWFTPSKKLADNFAGEFGDGHRTLASRVNTVGAMIENPFQTRDWDVVERKPYDEQWVKARQAEGYDSVKFIGGVGQTEYAIFDAKHIRIVDHGITGHP